MTRYSNPFYTLKEAEAVLKSIGADTLRNNPDTSPNAYDWREHVLSVSTRVCYVGLKEYHECQIHLHRDAFNALVQQIRDYCGDPNAYPVSVESFLDGEFYEHYIEPSELLRIFALVPANESVPSSEEESK